MVKVLRSENHISGAGIEAVNIGSISERRADCDVAQAIAVDIAIGRNRGAQQVAGIPAKDAKYIGRKIGLIDKACVAPVAQVNVDDAIIGKWKSAAVHAIEYHIG